MRTTGQFAIEIYQDRDFTRYSTGNQHNYQHIYLQDDEDTFSSVIGIKTFKEDTLLSSALIGGSAGATSINEHSVIYKDTRIIICCSNNIFCLSIPALQLLWQTEADIATCFQIFPYKEDYIVHGELAISRVNKDGKIVWQNSGMDIFVTLGGIQEFEMTEDYIIAKDWEYKAYVWDYNGNFYNTKP